jgi:hypothetical protein
VTDADRFLWARLSQFWRGWRSALVIVKPEIVVHWHRKGIPGIDPPDEPDNPLLGAPRIRGELLKLGIEIGETSVTKYLVRHRKPPSRTLRGFLQNHLKTIVSVDFFTVPTIRFEVLYVFLVLAHERRRTLHFGVAAHPTAEWTAQQLRGAFPWDTAPEYLLQGSGRDLRGEFHQADSVDGHQTSAFVAAGTMAARLCRAANRDASPRVPGL